MKKINLENMKNVLTRDEMKQVKGGSDEKCIQDGKSCGLITKCCHECLGTFICGKSVIGG